MKKFAVLIPERINIEEIVNVNPSLFREDYVRYIIHSIITKQGKLIDEKEIDEENKKKKAYKNFTEKYVPIKPLYKGGNYHIHKTTCEFLCSNSVPIYHGRYEKRKVMETSICERTNYKNDEKPFEYRFGRLFRKQKLKIEFIKDHKIVNQVIKNESKCDSEINRGNYKFLKKFFNPKKLEIDLDEAIKLCNERYSKHEDYNKYLKEMTQIINIYNGVYRLTYKKDSIGRVYTNLTQLNKVYRKFITYDNKPLAEVDVSNSVIFFLGILLDCNFKDNVLNILIDKNNINKIINDEELSPLLMFSKTLGSASIKEIELMQTLGKNGSFYDYFISDFENKFSFEELKFWYEKENEDEYIESERQIRKICKKQILAMLFADTDEYLETQEIFKIKFPELLEKLNQFKIEFGYKKVSHLLFQFEAFFVLNIVARNFNNKYWRKSPIFTLHDSLIVASNHSDDLIYHFEKDIEKILGSAPKVDVKKWR